MRKTMIARPIHDPTLKLYKQINNFWIEFNNDLLIKSKKSWTKSTVATVHSWKHASINSSAAMKI